jgi:CubicO group peptidase (beta-lactamase class C family)
MFRHLLVLVATLTASAGTVGLASGLRSGEVKKINATFAAWDNPATPGCALGVLRDGQMLYAHGYGLADVEHSVPITSTTVFHIDSLAKQFTAFAIYLLAKDGKLSIDDDIRKYLPELHDFGKTITIRHLLFHTSGLRDQWNLLALAGWRLTDEITEQDVLKLIWRQRELNFPPGEEQVYSNTGYTLLALIVQRVSGKSLREFSHDRMFMPLGMLHTHFQNQYGELVQNRAYSYERQSDGRYQYVAQSYSIVGPSNLFTTMEDVARWDENFYSGSVGGKDLLAQMQVRGKLNGGGDTDGAYGASGLVIGEYRGLRTVEHSGSDAGFRTELLRLPDAHLSVVTLCNAGDAAPTALGLRVVDIVLESQLEPVATPSSGLPPEEIKIYPALLGAYVGYYQFGPDFILAITREGDQLYAQPAGQKKFPIFPVSNTRFSLKGVGVYLTFDKPPDSSEARGITLQQGGHDQYAKRIEGAHPTPERMLAYAGTFYSDELDTLYTVLSHDGKLFVRYPRGESELRPTIADMFEAEFPFGAVSYRCSVDSRCDTFTVTDGRVRRLRFDRVDLTPVHRERSTP